MGVRARRALLYASATLALLAPGCGGDDGDDGDGAAAAQQPVKGTLAVYSSLPTDGPSAKVGAEVALGMRHALEQAGGRAGDWRVELVPLSSTRPGELKSWSGSAVRANARRAVRDRRSIAYLGELDQGGSSVSLPVTNRAGLLQVSPADGLSSLSRTVLGRPPPAAYSRGGKSTFVRFAAPDIDVARDIVGEFDDWGARRIASIGGGGLAGRELERQVLGEMRDTDGQGPRRAMRWSLSPDADRATTERVATEVAAAHPDAVVLMAPPGPASRALLAALAARLPQTRMYGDPPLAASRPLKPAPPKACAMTTVPVPASLPPRGRELLREIRSEAERDVGVHALLGHATMQLVLDAVAKAGADRPAVVAAARSTVDFDDVAVGYGLGIRAQIEGLNAACDSVGEPPADLSG